MKQVPLDLFLKQVSVIYDLKPSYKLGHDGSDGECDCIGLIRGALKRCGLNPSGLSGTNYAARFTLKNVKKFTSAGALEVGDIVLKVRDKDDADYPLPDKYRPGGTCYTGDLTNFTHIGVVAHVNPLRIVHMTSPSPQTDTKVGRWCYKAKLPFLDYSNNSNGGGISMPEKTATVISSNGKPVHIRQGKGTSNKVVCDVPCGTVVDVLNEGPDWTQVQVMEGTRLRSGWIMTEFLSFNGGTGSPDTGTDSVIITLSLADATAFLPVLDRIRDSIGQQVGRG